MLVRDATPADLAEIVAILNDAIEHTTAVWSEEAVTNDERGRWLAARSAAGHPVLVAEDAGDVCGFASFAEFRPWPGYAPTVELSVYVRADRRGRGIGRLLLSELVERARLLGKRVLIAGIEASNEASIRLHASAGFQRGGLLPRVGVKFERPLDLVLMYLPLDGGPAAAPDGTDPGRAAPAHRVEGLEGRLVRLEPLRPGHLAGLSLAAADLPELPFSFVPGERQTTTEYIAEALAGRDAGGEWPFATIRKADGAVVGTTRYMGIAAWRWPRGTSSERSNGLPDSVEIGATWLAESAWRTGINVEAKLLMLEHAFEVWRVHRVMLATDARNTRSRRAILALGAGFEGVRRADRPAADGTLRDTASFAITASDWPELRTRLVSRLSQTR